MVFERLVAMRLRNFMQYIGVVQLTQFVHRKGLDMYDALLCIFHVLQNSVGLEYEVRLVQLDYSAVFDRIYHLGALYRIRCYLWCVGLPWVCL